MRANNYHHMRIGRRTRAGGRVSAGGVRRRVGRVIQPAGRGLCPRAAAAPRGRGEIRPPVVLFSNARIDRLYWKSCITEIALRICSVAGRRAAGGNGGGALDDCGGCVRALSHAQSQGDRRDRWRQYDVADRAAAAAIGGSVDRHSTDFLRKLYHIYHIYSICISVL